MLHLIRFGLMYMIIGKANSDQLKSGLGSNWLVNPKRLSIFFFSIFLFVFGDLSPLIFVSNFMIDMRSFLDAKWISWMLKEIPCRVSSNNTVEYYTLHWFNPIPTRLYHVIYCHGDKKYPCLVGIGLLKHSIHNTIHPRTFCNSPKRGLVPNKFMGRIKDFFSSLGSFHKLRKHIGVGSWSAKGLFWYTKYLGTQR